MKVRWRFHALTVLSLLLCVATAMLWGRSRRTLYGFEAASGSGRAVLVCARNGTVRLSLYSADHPAMRGLDGWNCITFADPTVGDNVMDIQGLYTDSSFERQFGILGVEFWTDDERQIAFRLPCWFLIVITVLIPAARIPRYFRPRPR